MPCARAPWRGRRAHAVGCGRGARGRLFDQGIPATAFESSDLGAEFERLKGRGVAFTMAPTKAGPITLAVFSDTCGNLIQIYQPA